MGEWVVTVGDCRDVLAGLEPQSVDAVVCDPPYELSFMGKGWDGTGIAYDVAMWGEVLRVLRPGGHLLAFGGTRTFHRMTVAIEDAGFEVRDCLSWLYGSGFPKSLNVGKAIDKRGGSVAAFSEFRDDVKKAMSSNGLSRAALQEALGNFMLSHYLTTASQPAVPNLRDYLIIRDTVGLGNRWDEQFLPEAEREVVGRSDELYGRKSGIGNGMEGHTTVGGTIAEAYDVTVPATDEARRWEGWGTALKPAWEPIVMARKPLIGTVAGNVLAHGTGGLNIDGSRIAGVPPSVPQPEFSREMRAGFGASAGRNGDVSQASGRWPANVLLDEGAAAALDEQSGVSKSGAAGKKGSSGFVNGYDGDYEVPYGDSGGASRFFYVAKASRRDRNEGLDDFQPKRDADRITDDGVGGDNPRNRSNTPRANHHPTVKPTDLMRHLVRLVTPPGGLVLDPFTGSGSTGKAAVLEGFRFHGIEQDAEYAEIARARIAWAEQQVDAEQPTLM